MLNSQVNKSSITSPERERRSYTVFDNSCAGFFIMEKWDKITGYEHRYLVSSYGRVLRLPYTQPHPQNKLFPCYHKLAVISPSIKRNGYYNVVLSNNRCKKTFSVHRLVATVFIKKISGKDHVNHKDGNKLNNHIENLEWCTDMENRTHARINGLYCSGAKHHHSSAVLQIKDDKVIAEYETIISAQKHTGIYNISAACSGKRPLAGGYKWNYKN